METIVVGVDGSDESHAALSWARDEARVRAATVRAVHAWQPIAYSVPPPAFAPSPFDFREDLEKDARQVLEDAVAQDAAEHSDVQVRAELVEGPPAASLLAAAVDADLLVVGSRGRGGFRGLLLGSVSQQCAHHTPCPLVVVRSGAPADTGQSDAIVVGVDGSPQSEAALHWAMEEAERHRGEVFAVHAWTDPYTLSTAYVEGPTSQGIVSEARATLAKVVARAAGRYPGVRCEQVVSEGSAARVLVEAAATARLLVVGTRGRGGFAGLLLGSVSQQCAHHAPCPVVIIPA